MTDDTTGEVPWYHRGACVGSDSDLFFLDNSKARAEALAYCADCTVSEECLAVAMTLPQRGEGIWGGMTQSRRVLRYRSDNRRKQRERESASGKVS